MYNYKECSHCGTITEDDEQKCPKCNQNPFLEERYSEEELIEKIKKGEKFLHQLKVKHLGPFVSFFRVSSTET